MKKGKNILVGVCAGIASYKTCELVRLLVKGGYSVKVVMTEAAAKFVSPLVFQALSNNPVYTDMFSLDRREGVEHISLADWPDLCVIAPLTANTLSKIAGGICDNLLTTVVCAFSDKVNVLLVPAMNEKMWQNKIIQDNADKLRRLGKYMIMPPEKGELACGACGDGRMPEPEEIFEKITEKLKN
jgi:phosphopantothenoylcysteine decarboxylase/phosphopantothenate--cysteine ligase